MLMMNRSLPTQPADHAGNDNNYCNRSKTSATINASLMSEHIRRAIASASLMLLSNVVVPFTLVCELMNRNYLHNDAWATNNYFHNDGSSNDNYLKFAHIVCKVVNTNKCLRVGSSARCDQASSCNARLDAYPIDVPIVYHYMYQPRIGLHATIRYGSGAHA